MFRKSGAMLGAVVLLAAGGALAQQTAQPPVVLGPGTMPCSSWLSSRANQEPTGLVWVTGYLSAMNLAGFDASRNITDGVTIDQVGAQMDIHCREDPNQQINAAMMKTLGDLLRRKGYDPAPILTPRPLPRLPQQ